MFKCGYRKACTSQARLERVERNRYEQWERVVGIRAGLATGEATLEIPGAQIEHLVPDQLVF